MGIQTNLNLTSEQWKSDVTWGTENAKSSQFDPTEIDPKEKVLDHLNEIIAKDIDDNIFYPTTFLENLHQFTDRAALLAFYDANDGVDVFTAYLDSRLGMTLTALRELSSEEYEKKAIHVLSHAQHFLDLFREYCRNENVNYTDINGGQRLAYLQNIICHYELGLLKGTETNRKEIFNLLVRVRDINAYPAVRGVFIEDIMAETKVNRLIPILSFIENNPQYLHKDLFYPLLHIWNKIVLRDINRVKGNASRTKSLLANKVYASLTYLYSIYGYEQLGLDSKWEQTFKESLGKNNVGKKLGLMN